MTLSDREDILALLQAHLPLLLGRQPVLAAYLYGSVARGTMSSDSDIDLGLLFNEGLPHIERFELALALGSEINFTLQLPHEIDVRDLGEMPLRVLGPVLAEGICVYAAHPEDVCAYEEQILTAYHECLAEMDEADQHFIHRILKEGFGG